MPLITTYECLSIQYQSIENFAIDYPHILSKYLEIAFSHADSLNHSFISEDSMKKICIQNYSQKVNKMEDINDESLTSTPSSELQLSVENEILEPDIDVIGISKFYKFIKVEENKGSKEYSDKILKGLSEVVLTLKKTASRINTASKLRQILIIILNPNLMESEYFEIILDIFKAVSSLNESMRKALVHWLYKIPKENFYEIITTVQHYITLNIYHYFVVDDSIMYATMFLSLLNDSNELHHNDSLKIDYKEFYNDAVNNIVDLKSDVLRWNELKRRLNLSNSQIPVTFENFTFINYPFILDANSKSLILSVSSKIEQQQIVTGSIVSSLFSGGQINPYLIIKVDRNNLIETALQQIDANRQHLKKPLKVKFIGEEGMDEGGVRKEMFLMIVREMFNENYGMFTYNKEAGTYWFSEASVSSPTEYNLIGTVIGLALYNGVILDVQFPILLYKKLCGLEPTLEDVYQVDPELAKGLTQLLEFDGDVEYVYSKNFVVETESFGVINSHELIPNGENISVTNENRKQFVDLYIKWKFTESVKERFDAFFKGFNSVIGELISIFKPQELELLVCGSPKLDFQELKKGTHYAEGYTSDSQVVHWLWDVIDEFTDEEKKKFLHFCTGSDRAPISGLKSTKLVVIKNGDSDERLPTAHTCFNLFLLPQYSSKENLRERLRKAIEHYKGFGLQ